MPGPYQRGAAAGCCVGYFQAIRRMGEPNILSYIRGRQIFNYQFIRVDFHRYNHLKPSARDGSDNLLVFSIVSNGGACCANTCANCWVRYDKTIPDFINKLITGHKVTGISDQHQKNIKNLRLDMNHLTTTGEFVPIRINGTIGKVIDHALSNVSFESILKKKHHIFLFLKHKTRLS